MEPSAQWRHASPVIGLFPSSGSGSVLSQVRYARCCLCLKCACPSSFPVQCDHLGLRGAFRPIINVISGVLELAGVAEVGYDFHR